MTYNRDYKPLNSNGDGGMSDEEFAKRYKAMEAQKKAEKANIHKAAYKEHAAKHYEELVSNLQAALEEDKELSEIVNSNPFNFSPAIENRLMRLPKTEQAKVFKALLKNPDHRAKASGRFHDENDAIDQFGADQFIDDVWAKSHAPTANEQKQENKQGGMKQVPSEQEVAESADQKLIKDLTEGIL